MSNKTWIQKQVAIAKEVRQEENRLRAIEDEKDRQIHLNYLNKYTSLVKKEITANASRGKTSTCFTFEPIICYGYVMNLAKFISQMIDHDQDLVGLEYKVALCYDTLCDHDEDHTCVILSLPLDD